MTESQTDERSYSIALELLSGYEFKVRLDWEEPPAWSLDEPPPLGEKHGPNASRALAAAVGHCLAASLLFCLRRSRIEPTGMKSVVTVHTRRSPKGRARIARMSVRLDLGIENADESRVKRCLDIFEDYCVVTESVRQGIPIEVGVFNDAGRRLNGA